MKHFQSFLFIAMFATIFSGCKDDTIVEEYNLDIPFFGLWEVLESDNEDRQFVKFEDDLSLTIYSENTDGFRSVYKTLFHPAESQLIFSQQYAGSTIFNYQMNGDTLTITYGNDLVFMKGVKSTSTLPDNWVTTVSSIDIMEGLFSDFNTGMGFDGSNLLFTNYSEGKIIKVSLATRTVVDEITTVNSLNTVEFDGVDYWVSRNGFSQLLKVNAAGTEIFNSIDLGPWIYGIGYVSNTSIVCYAANTNTIYNYNPISDAINSSKQINSVSFRDIAISNGKIFIISVGNIYKLNTSTFAVEATYDVEGVNSIQGIAAVGSNVFWISTDLGSKVLKVDLN